jgi:hypothetical protein
MTSPIRASTGVRSRLLKIKKNRLQYLVKIQLTGLVTFEPTKTLTTEQNLPTGLKKATKSQSNAQQSLPEATQRPPEIL